MEQVNKSMESDPTPHLSVAVSRCAPLFELKVDGRLYSFFTIHNKGPCRMAYRVLPSVPNRYTCHPSFGCLGRYTKQVVVIYTTSFPMVSSADIAGDEFITEIFPTRRFYEYPETVEWLFSSEKYNKDELRRFNSVFIKPIIITFECIQDSVHLGRKADSRASDIFTAQLDKAIDGEQIFLNKIHSYFYKKNCNAKTEWSTLIIPGIKYGILPLIGLLGFGLGQYKVILVLQAIGAW